MKKLVLALLSFISLSAFAQGTLTVTVSDSGTVAPGVAVFYYDSPSSFYPNGYNNPPVIENFDSYAFTSGNGVASFGLWNVANNDTVFWATQDCAGNLIWGAGSPTAMNPNLSGTLNLGCLPGACDVILTVDSAATPAATYGVIQAFPLLQFSYTGLPNNIPSFWTLNGVPSSGFTSADYDSITFNMNTVSAPYTVTYARVDSFCVPRTVTFGNNGGGGTSVTCNSYFTTTALGQDSLGYRVLIADSSSTNGTIIGYRLDMGDGNVLNATGAISSHNHAYVSAGTYTICQTITAVLGNDTCSSTYCDTVTVGSGSGGGGGVGPSCAASYVVDTVNSGLFNNQLIIWETSTSNGQISAWSWDFGDGTTINTRYPSHTYANTGVYNVCLTITALDSAGATCTSTFCDSVGFDANGNLVFKNGFTINVVDPASVGLDEQLLNESLSVYPNPSAGDVNLEWDPRLEVEKLSVFSISGSLINEITKPNHRTELKGLKPGAYLVRIQSATAAKTLRLIVQ